MPRKEDYKAMHDDAMSIMDVARRMSGFSANHLVDEDEDDEEEMEDEGDSEVAKKLRKKMMLKKLKRMSK